MKSVNMNSGSPVITLNKLCKVFHTEEVDTYALQDVDLEIKQGEFVAITGPSGCGKSTLLSMLGLLDTFNSGNYILNGRDVSDLRLRELAVIRNHEIGFIFQAFNLIADLSVEANVTLPLTYRNMDKAERRDRVLHALELVKMDHRLKHYPGQLSGGQQQRVAVARALAGDPKLLLADEPTGNLDSKNGEVVMELLDSLHANGSTLCMVTHDVDFAQRADRVIYMKDGQMVKGETSANAASLEDVGELAS